MGASSSRANQTSWSVNVTLEREGAEVTYTLSSTTESLVKVIKGSGGSTITMIVNPMTGEMTLDDKSSGKDGDLVELTSILKDDLISSIAKRWNLEVEEDSESDEEAVETETEDEEVKDKTEDSQEEPEYIPGSELQTDEEDDSDGWDSE